MTNNNNNNNFLCSHTSYNSFGIPPFTFQVDETPIGIVAPPPQQPSQSAPGSERGSPTSLSAPSATAEASVVTAVSGTPRPPPDAAAAAPTLEYPPVAEMADVMDEYQALSERLSQHWSRLTEVLRADPDSQSEEETRGHQALFNQVTHVMHLMSHSQHALSDLMLNFDRPRPRVLRASPFIFPLPVQTTITATGPPVRFATAAPSPSASPAAASRRQVSEAAGSSPSPVSTSTPAAMATSVAATPSATSEADQPQHHGGSHQLQQHLQQHLQHVQAALGGHVTASAAAASGVTNSATRPPASPVQTVRVAQVPVGPPVVGPIVVGIPVDVTATQSAAGANANGRPAQQNFLESILRPALNGIAGGGSGSMSFEITTSSQAASPSPPGENSSSPTMQDTTARQSTQTHPTASTRTPRATPHVHYAAPFPPPPQMPLNGPMGSHFDPFLPCQSHHVIPPRSRHPARRMPLRPRSASVPPRNNNSSNAVQSGDQELRAGGGGSRGGGSPQLAQRRFVVPAPPPPGFFFGPPSQVSVGQGWVVNAAAPHAHLVSVGTPPSGQRHPSPPQPPPGAVLDPSLQGLLNQLRASDSGSQDEANMINMVQGILGQVIGALGGAGPGLGGTVADFLNGLPDYQFTEGESTLTDFLMTLARNMTFGDLIPLVLGQGDVRVNQLQQPLNQFVRSNILQTETDDPSDEVS